MVTQDQTLLFGVVYLHRKNEMFLVDRHSLFHHAQAFPPSVQVTEFLKALVDITMAVLKLLPGSEKQRR